MFILDVSGDRGQIIIEMSPQFAFVLIERLLGGGGLGTEVAENLSRPLTQIEQSLIRGMIERASEELKKAWSMIDTLEFTVQKYESDADIVQVAPASEIVLVISFNISLEDKIYHLSICYPVFTIEDSIAKITTQRFVSSKRYSSAEYSRYISRRIRTTKVPIRVELGQSEITLEELMKLEVGDIIILDTKVDSEVKIFIADRLKLFGKPGVYDGRKAVKITRIANNEE
jgi:flagellar motor switch protein FliM